MCMYVSPRKKNWIKTVLHNCVISKLKKQKHMLRANSTFCLGWLLLQNTQNVRVFLYIAYIACGSALLYIKMLYFFLSVLALWAAATVADIKIRYDAKTPYFAIFWRRVTCHMCVLQYYTFRSLRRGTCLAASGLSKIGMFGSWRSQAVLCYLNASRRFLTSFCHFSFSRV